MKWIFKVIQGQHKGAELALPAGCCFTAGRAAACDLVLLDATLPAEAFTLECTEKERFLTPLMEGVLLGAQPLAKGVRVPLPLYTIVSAGMTQFCLGEAGKPWPMLRTMRRKRPPGAPHTFRSRAWFAGRSLGLLALKTAGVLALLLAGAVIAGRLLVQESGNLEQTLEQMRVRSAQTPETLAAHYRLHLVHTAEQCHLSGNVSTRALRDEIRARLFAIAPDATAEITDDETLHAAAETVIQLMEEPHLGIAAATNRTLVLCGKASSSGALDETVALLRSELPYLQRIETAAVEPIPAGKRPVERVQSAAVRPKLPIVALVLSPCPSVILKDGSRHVQGSSVNGYTIVNISADGVDLDCAGERCRWTL